MLHRDDCGLALECREFLLTHGDACLVDERSYDSATGESGFCYRNFVLRMHGDHGLDYCEGVVIAAGRLLQHAWLVDKDRRVVEPSRPLVRGSNESDCFFGVVRSISRVSQQQAGFVVFVRSPPSLMVVTAFCRHLRLG
jgi:hypothetical protein